MVCDMSRMHECKKVVWLSGLVWWLCVMGPVSMAAGMEEGEGVPGRVMATREATLSSPMSGRIEQMHCREMQMVKEDEELVRMDCLLLEGELIKTAAMLDTAQKKAQVLRSLQSLDSVGELDVVLAESDVQVSAAAVDMLQGQLSRCRMQVPFSGVVHRVMVDPHQYVTEGQPLVELVSLKNLEVELLLPSEWLLWLPVEAPFKMAIKETGATHDGHLVRIDSVVDFGSQTVRARGVITSQDGVQLLPGMSGTAYFSKPAVH